MRNLRDNYRKNKLRYCETNEYQLKKHLDAAISEITEDVEALTGRVAILEADVNAMKPLISVTVTFDSDGGSSVASQIISFDTTATEPDDPTKEGSEFVGWFKDEEAFDFATKIRANTTLTAHWSE